MLTSPRALYPISWGLSEGGNRIQVDSESVFYGVLDIFTQGVFSVVLIAATRKLDFDRMGLGFTEYGRIRDHDNWRDGIHQEKAGRAANGTGYAADGGGLTGVGAPGITAPGATRV